MTEREYELATLIINKYQYEIAKLKELLAHEPFMFKDRKLTGSLIVHDDMYKKGYAQAQLDLSRAKLLERDNQISKLVGENSKLREDLRALYLAPPTREPLSDQTIAKIWGESYSGTTQMVRKFARAIEKAHGIGGE